MTKTISVQGILSDLRERGWSDAGIAGRLGCTRTIIWYWRTGQREPEMPGAIRFALQYLRRLVPR
ncbi:MAG: hypothetical protein O2821_12760 [Chloroflexi bacterium]|nr:hypothetical protein [Chloroflexota bacterium]